MKHRRSLARMTVLSCIGLSFAGAWASPQIAAKAGCVACHVVDKKLVGPSWHDVAAKYKGQADAPARLAAVVRKGGVGVWGQVPMAPVDATRLTDAELKAVVAWVLKTP